MTSKVSGYSPKSRRLRHLKSQLIERQMLGELLLTIYYETIYYDYFMFLLHTKYILNDK